MFYNVGITGRCFANTGEGKMKKSRKTLPLEKNSNGNYNNVAGNIAGGLQREGVGKCTDAELLNQEILKIFQNLQPKKQEEFICLVRSLFLTEQEEVSSAL